jgi:hypothetical protein
MTIFELHHAGFHFHLRVTKVAGEDQFLVNIELDVAEVDVLLFEFGFEVPGEWNEVLTGGAAAEE